MDGAWSRTASLIGEDGVKKLSSARVILFGVGGVGSYCAEALARAGVGTICLVDPDTVAVSNLNRQLVALHSTIGKNKAEVMRERILDINPSARVTAVRLFYLPENADEIELSHYDVVIDAVDTVSAKVELAVRAQAAGIPILSAMGTGNKLHPELLELADLSETEACPLARVMRRELRARGITHMRVVYSREIPIVPNTKDAKTDSLSAGKRRTPGSISFVPSCAGLLLASEAVNILLGPTKREKK